MRLQAAEGPSTTPAAPDPTLDEQGDRQMRTALLQLLRDAVAANKRVEVLERQLSIQAARLDELTRHIARLERTRRRGSAT